MLERLGGRPRPGLFGRMAAKLRPRPEAEEPAVHPFRPREHREVPEAAWRDLEQACGPVALQRLFVVPGSTTAAFRGRRRTTPTRVLAFADRAVALWTAAGPGGADAVSPRGDAPAGTLEAIATSELLAVDDCTILLYGRLSLVGVRGRIVVPYNTVARHELRDNVAQLRSRIAGPPEPVAATFLWLDGPGVQRPAAELPYKWAYLLRFSPDLRLDPGAPAAIAAGGVTELGARRSRRRRNDAAAGMALLGPRELVIAAEPAEHLDGERYGVDLTVVPRQFLFDLARDGRSLRIRLRRPDGRPMDEPIVRSLDPRLIDAMRRSFGDAVAWS